MKTIELPEMDVLVNKDGDVLISKYTLSNYGFFCDHEMEEVNRDYNRILGLPLMRDSILRVSRDSSYILLVTMEGRLFRVNRDSSELIHIELDSPVDKIIGYRPVAVLDVTRRLILLDDNTNITGTIDDVEKVISFGTYGELVLTKDTSGYKRILRCVDERINNIDIDPSIEVNSIHNVRYRVCCMSDVDGRIHKIDEHSNRIAYELYRKFRYKADDYSLIKYNIFMLKDGILLRYSSRKDLYSEVKHERKFARFVNDTDYVEDEDGILYELSNSNQLKTVNIPVRLMNVDITPITVRRLKNPRTRMGE